MFIIAVTNEDFKYFLLTIVDEADSKNESTY